MFSIHYVPNTKPHQNSTSRSVDFNIIIFYMGTENYYVSLACQVSQVQKGIGQICLVPEPLFSHHATEGELYGFQCE